MKARGHLSQAAPVELPHRRERERLSHDLHDGTIQSLYALQLGLSRAGEQARSALPALGTRLAEYRQNLTSVIGELRGFILRHEADAGPASDLAGVLATLVERLRSTSETVLHAELSPEAARRLSGEQAVHLANLAREALSNALRHAHAAHITVTLRDEPVGVTLEIADDGCGFDPAQPPHAGLGLTSMASRAQQAGGALHLESLGAYLAAPAPACSLAPRGTSGERAGERGAFARRQPSSPQPSPPAVGGEGVRLLATGAVSRGAQSLAGEGTRVWVTVAVAGKTTGRQG